MKRFQESNWLIKLWRFRWYLTIPFNSFNLWRKSQETFELCWKLELGMAQCKMNWVYTTEEVMGHIYKKLSIPIHPEDDNEDDDLIEIN